MQRQEAVASRHPARSISADPGHRGSEHEAHNSESGFRCRQLTPPLARASSSPTFFALMSCAPSPDGLYVPTVFSSITWVNSVSELYVSTLCSSLTQCRCQSVKEMIYDRCERQGQISTSILSASDYLEKFDCVIEYRMATPWCTPPVHNEHATTNMIQIKPAMQLHQQRQRLQQRLTAAAAATEQRNSSYLLD